MRFTKVQQQRQRRWAPVRVGDAITAMSPQLSPPVPSSDRHGVWPVCIVCCYPMNPVVVQGGYMTHPGCDGEVER